MNLSENYVSMKNVNMKDFDKLKLSDLSNSKSDKLQKHKNP